MIRQFKMWRSSLVLGCFVWVSLGVAPMLAQNRVRRDIPRAPPNSPEEQLKLFHLPPGFQIELVACEPDTPKPINMNFDARGRLFFSHSVAYPFAPLPGQAPGDAIKMLVDEDGDGVPEKVTTFAGNLSIPVGVTPIPGGVLGLSIPNLYRFLDDNGDGQADRREFAYGEFGYGDTHGMVSSLTWWIDGWIYGCHSNNNQSTARGADGQTIVIRTGNTHRFRVDGSHIEFFTLGQVNPFGITMDPLGNIFNADCHTKPITMLLRGGYYPDVLFKGHDGLGFAPTMMRHTHGSTGLAGIVYYAAEGFPEEYRDTIFIGNPITGRINHDRLEARGSTYQAIEQPDFLSCDDPWFRPVDLQLAPDGSLYIADFYAPIIAHYEVPLTHPRRDRSHGRIWRVSHIGVEGKLHTPAPDLTEASADELIGYLSDENIVIRTHATHQLVHRIGRPAVALIRAKPLDVLDARQRAHGLWVFQRLGALDPLTIQGLAGDPDRLVRVHLMKALAEEREWDDRQRGHVRRALQDEDAFVRRAAAEALGLHAHDEDITALIDLWNRSDAEDTHLVHATRIALRNSILQLGNLPALARKYEGRPTYLSRVADICLGIRNPQSAKFLLGYHQKVKPEGIRRDEILHHIGRYVDSGSLPALYRLITVFRDDPAPARLEVIRTLHRAAQERGGALPADIVRRARELASELLADSNPASSSSAIGVVQELQIKEAVPSLVKMVTNPQRRPGPPRRGPRRANVQFLALDALVAVDEESAVSSFLQLLNDPRTSSGVRWRMEKAMGQLNEQSSYRSLLEQLRVVSEIVEITIVRGLSGSVGGARALFAAIEEGTLASRILRDPRVNVNLHYASIPDLDQRMSRLTQDLPVEDERLYNLIEERRRGVEGAQPDRVRGKQVFSLACAPCHQIAGEGGKVGPNLDGVGVRGLDRLLEDIIDPSRNVEPSFRATFVLQKDGRLIIGRVLGEEGKILVVVDELGKEQRIPLSDVKERRPLNLSSMPANVSETVSESDFYDLIGYLLDQKVKPGTPVE